MSLGTKKLNWNLVGGTNAYFIKENDRYEEVFVGLENIFKIFDSFSFVGI